MNNIEMILKLMSSDLNDYQLKKLHNVLDTILKTEKSLLSNQELLDRFAQNKQLVGLSSTSMQAYIFELKTMMRYLPGKNIAELTTSEIKDYLSAYVKERHISAQTLQTKIRYLSSFYDFCVNDDIIDKNPTKKIEKIKKEKKLKRAFSHEDIEALRNACELKRDRAFLEFLYSTGCRISEALNVKVRELDFDNKELVVFGKGSKERIVYLSNICIQYLKEYLDDRYAQLDEFLFTPVNTNHKMTTRAAELILKDLGIKANVENVHPHRFRRTMATHALEKGMPIEQIKEVLGHSDIDTTMIYCNVNTEKVKDNFIRIFDD